MKPYITKYPAESAQHTEFVELKLKLKNECPDALAQYVDKVERKARISVKGLFGCTPKLPIEIQALADLHLEATYQIGNAPWSPPAPKNGWDAAKKFCAYREQQVDPNPGKPVRSYSNSSQASTGSASSVPSVKSVKWAETLEAVKLFSSDD